MPELTVKEWCLVTLVIIAIAPPMVLMGLAQTLAIVRPEYTYCHSVAQCIPHLFHTGWP